MKVEQLRNGFHEEFAEYMRYVKSLSYGEMPEYAKLKELFRGLANKARVQYHNVFDWTEQVYIQQAVQARPGIIPVRASLDLCPPGLGGEFSMRDVCAARAEHFTEVVHRRI